MLWFASNNTGIAQIDRQHRELFQWSYILLNNQNEQDLENLLHALQHYIQEHFSREELLMRSCEYPKYILHKGYHQVYLLRFSLLKEFLLEEQDPLRQNSLIQAHVVAWFQGHISTKDQEFAQFYLEQNKEPLEEFT